MGEATIFVVTTFAEGVMLHPSMYTLNGTYEEVVAFLEGYYSAAIKGRATVPACREWFDFGEWLAQKLGVSRSDVFRKVRQDCGGSPESLQQLLQWFSEYRVECVSPQ